MACFDLKKLVVGRWWKCIEGKRDVIVDMQSWRPIFYWLNDWMMKKNWIKKELVVAMHSWVLTTNIYWLNDWMMEKYWSKKGSDRCYVVLTTNFIDWMIEWWTSIEWKGKWGRKMGKGKGRGVMVLMEYPSINSGMRCILKFFWTLESRRTTYACVCKRLCPELSRRAV